MNSIRIADTWIKVTDNSPLMNQDTQDSINGLAKSLGITTASIWSRVQEDRLTLDKQVMLNDLLGLGQEPSSKYRVTAILTFGKGKKHVGQNRLEIHTYAYGAGPYRTLNEGRLKDMKFDSIEETLEGVPVELIKEKFTEADTKACEQVRKAYSDMVASQTERDIDLADLPDRAENIFGEFGIKVKAELENSLDKSELNLSDADDNIYGTLRLTYKPGSYEHWITSSSGTFGFVDPVLTMESSWRGKSGVRLDKVDDFLRLVAEEYAREAKIRERIKAQKDAIWVQEED